MKKLTIACTITAGILGSTVVQADTAAIFDNWQDRAYAQAKLGFADMGFSDSAMTLTGVAGLETPSIHPMLSFEADMLLTIADAEQSYPSSMGSTTAEASAFSLGGYAVANFDDTLVENMTPFVRLGLAYTSIDVSVSNSVASADGEDSEIGLGFSGGVRYQVTDQLSAVADYTSVSSLDILNVGVSYRF